MNQGSGDVSQSRMKLTMYITGKSQKFALNPTATKNGQRSNEHNPTLSTMIINLGDRTHTNIGNAKQNTVNDIDMLVGSTDIVTGASHVAHPSNRNF